MSGRLMLRKATLGIWMWILVGVGSLHAESSHLTGSGDIRVLIDISGSMKKNDPQNLRRPALKLITKLLPRRQQSRGLDLWSVRQRTSALKSVDSAWREDASKSRPDQRSVAYLPISVAYWKNPSTIFSRARTTAIPISSC